MIIIDKGENVGNTIKLVSGFILFVIGVLLAYETSVYNLIDILLIVGIIIAIVGVIVMVSYFVESNATRTTDMIKEFMESREGNSSSLRGLDRKSNENEGPLRVRRDYDDFDEITYDDIVVDDYQDSSTLEFFGSSVKDNPKAVLFLFVKPLVPYQPALSFVCI